MYSLLQQEVAAFTGSGGDWGELITEAEFQGVAPLLAKHLTAIDYRLPRETRRQLQALCLRSRRANAIRGETTAAVLARCRAAGIEVLAVKGIALSTFAYSEPGLRPMRDVDLLAAEKDLSRLQELLVELGFRLVEEESVPDDFYHLTPLCKEVEGLPVPIEVHRNLLPFHAQYPRWPLERSLAGARSITIGHDEARTLSLEDTLTHCYFHGFQAPLTYEPFRLIHVADLVSLVEGYRHEIDWQLLRHRQPRFCNVLSRLHFLTPWQDDVVEELHLVVDDAPRGVGRPYRGWPQRRLTEEPPSRWWELARETFWPAQWWLQLYYGHLDGLWYHRMRWFEHPRTVWRWMKTYAQAGRKSSKRAAR